MKSAAMPMPQKAAAAPPGLPMPATVRLFHPFPTLLNVAATAALAFVAVDGTPDGWTLARMLGVMLAAQGSIGVTNDIFDRKLDAQTKPWKPLVAGAVSMPTAVVLACALVATAAALAATLGATAWALAMLGLACGLAYDAGLKRTIASAVPFMVAIPTLPLWVWVALGRWDGVLWWLLPLGALIGLALHLANTLGDIDGDAAHDVRGLAHRLGREWSALVAWASFALVLALTGAIAPLIGYEVRTYVAAAASGAAALVFAGAMVLLRRDAWGYQLGFGALGAGAAVTAAGWLAAAT